MKSLILKIFFLFVVLVINISAKNIDSITNSHWETLHLYHGENQKQVLLLLMITMWSLSLVEDMNG